MSPKPGRNDPCWCGSGKKYKRCHQKQDAEEKSALAPTAIEPVGHGAGPFPFFKTEPPARTSEQIAADEEWERFEQADLEGQIALFLEKLDSKRLDDNDAFEMLDSIRTAADPRHNAEFRARFAAWLERLRRELPEVYAKSAGYYVWSWVDDIMADQRWEALPNVFAGYAELVHRNIDAFTHVREALLYHGQTRPLFDVMHAAWPMVSDSSEIMPWGIEEFGGILMSLVFFDYLDKTANPRADDPGLVEALKVYGEPRLEWFDFAIRHLAAPAPSAWQVQDFGEQVDAEQWERNLDALLFEFMADQHRRGVALSKGNLAREQLRHVLLQQFAEAPAQPGGKGRKKAKRALPASSSPLIPRQQLLDRALGEGFNIFDSQPYESGALIELTPAYLHFLARLGLIHPTEMDQALEDLQSLGAQMVTVLDGHGADVHTVQAIAAAWSDDALETWRRDPALEAARAQAHVIQPAPQPIQATAQTFTFKVVYRQQPDAWFSIEMRGDQTLHALHQTILDAADFDDDHLYSFYLSGRAWDKATEYSHGPEARHSSSTPVRKLPLRMKQRFLYLFDYGDQHEFDVQLVATSAAPPRGNYPRIIEQHGDMPPQYPNWDAEEWAEDELADEEEIDDSDEE